MTYGSWYRFFGMSLFEGWDVFMSFWGKTLAVVSAVPATYAGVTKGAYYAASGKGSFDEGFNSVVDPVVESAERFGDEYGKSLTGAAIYVGSRLAGAEIDKHKGQLP